MSPTRIPDDDLLGDLRRVAAMDESSDPPKIKEYDYLGEYTNQTFYRRFGSWGEALTAAGVDHDPLVTGRGQTIPTADLGKDLKRVADGLGRIPSRRDYDEHGEFSSSTATRRLGTDDTWRSTLTAAGLPGLSNDQPRAPTLDSLPDGHERCDDCGNIRPWSEIELVREREQAGSLLVRRLYCASCTENAQQNATDAPEGSA